MFVIIFSYFNCLNNYKVKNKVKSLLIVYISIESNENIYLFIKEKLIKMCKMREFKKKVIKNLYKIFE